MSSIVARNKSKLIYNQPPILEAVIAVYFSHPIVSNDLIKKEKRLKKNYDLSDIQSNVTIQVKGDSSLEPKFTKGPEQKGFRLLSTDMTKSLQIWPGMFLISQRSPYVGWDFFKERFFRDWNIFFKSNESKEISQIGMRYINRIDVPVKNGAEAIKPEDFLTINPSFPNSLSQIKNFSIQSVVELADIGSQLKLSSQSVPSPILGYSSLLLDIDIIKNQDLPNSQKALNAYLDIARVKKNEIFEMCITDMSRNLFK